MAAELGSTALAVRGVYREFGGVRAVDGASFNVEKSRITGLIGPNGAGKSTLLGIVAGAIDLSAGSVTFEGADVTGLPAYQIARRGLIRTFQLSSEFSRLTVLENLLYAAPAQKGASFPGAMLGRRYWIRQELQLVERARELLERFEMENKEDEYAGNLSGGQKRLLELARALMAMPKLLLLDEPMAGVNPSLVTQIEKYLLDLRAQGLTMLMVEHELGVVERLCDHVVVMAHGKVVAQGTMAEVRAQREVLDAYFIG